jgi:nucleoside-diphosphate-sugar epimerase
MKVVIAGASGFVGKGFLKDFSTSDRAGEATFIGLSRRARQENAVEWRAADLLDFSQTCSGVRGADVAIYLVHAMLPQARLNQGAFQDFDLLQADHFSEACHHEGVKHIIYLGGLIPEGLERSELSEHLRSRLEVEDVLRSRGATLTSLRAGLILGKGGSSAEILTRLVRRLPFMITPRWTRNFTEAVDLSDVTFAIRSVLFQPELQGKTWDLGSGEKVTYADLIRVTADNYGKSRQFLAAPFFSPGLSKLWVKLITGAPRALVYPLIDSLSHPMLPRNDFRLFPALKHRPVSIAESIKVLAREAAELPHAYQKQSAVMNTVYSIQRIPLHDSSYYLAWPEKIAEFYFRWLPKLFFNLLSVKAHTLRSHAIQDREAEWSLGFNFLKLDLLRLKVRNSHSFSVSGGALAKRKNQNGVLEFRVISSQRCVLTCVLNFQPRLPWTIYRFTQALLHLWVVGRFRQALLRAEKKGEMS